MTKKCKRCAEAVKTWEGDDPVCFLEKEFSDNWNCATLNALRDLLPDWPREPVKSGIHIEYLQDQKYATLDVSEIGEFEAWCLYVTWYKRRGRTDQVYLMTSDTPPRIPTEDELNEIIQHYESKI